MKGRTIMEMGDYRRLPKGLRRMLVFSETFFFEQHGKGRPPKKTQRAEAHKASASLAFLQKAADGFDGSLRNHFFHQNRSPFWH